jgi:hypothetical protein
MPRLHRAAALLLLCTILAGPRESRAVNLVPNPSFETYSGCPTSFSQLYQAAPWDAPTTGTSDYLNTCVSGWPGFPVPAIPQNPVGIQTPRTGDGMGGFIVRNVNDYHEYLQAPLASPLVNGQSYLVKFYVNLGDTSFVAIDRIGAYLSVGAIGPLAMNTTLLLTPQVESPAFGYLNDTVNWMLISGLYTASGGEDHIVIGSFRDDATTNTQPTGFSWPVSYYYIDDVSVELQLPTGQACCGSDGTCSMQFPGECQLLGGTPAGAGSTCTPNPCNATPARRSSWGSLKTLYR